MSFTQTQTFADKDNCYGYRSLNLTLNIHHVTFKLIRTITSTCVCISSDLLRKFGNAQTKSCLSERQYGDRQLGHQKIEDIEKASRPQFYHDL